ncbi:MAG: hypothetical protein JOY96_08520 [Verrucomicrobia bacterium]|nr:hypothetical protein [Verrucomicrobiota bacterium]
MNIDFGLVHLAIALRMMRSAANEPPGPAPQLELALAAIDYSLLANLPVDGVKLSTTRTPALDRRRLTPKFGSPANAES